jgi:hypothetical protein
MKRSRELARNESLTNLVARHVGRTRRGDLALADGLGMFVHDGGGAIRSRWNGMALRSPGEQSDPIQQSRVRYDVRISLGISMGMSLKS